MIVISILAEVWSTFLEMAPYLLLGLTFAGILHVLFNKETVARYLGKSDFWSVLKAAILGIPLPLCSCGVMPTGLSLRKNNASEGATVAFLISTPQTGVDSIIATYGMLGPVFAIFRPFAALVMGIFGGVVTNLLGKGGTTANPVAKIDSGPSGPAPVVQRLGWIGKIRSMAMYAYTEFLDDISVHIVAGVVISGLISFFLPDDFFTKYIAAGWVSMLLMIVVGIPLYVCATASIPIAAAMMMKGLDPGAAFVFLAVGPATNAATITVIGRVMGKRVAAIYLGTIAFSAVGAGFILNLVSGFSPGLRDAAMAHAHHHSAGGIGPVALVASYAFLLLMIMSLTRRFFPGVLKGLAPLRAKETGASPEPDLVLGVEGMTCSHCASHVTEALREVQGVTSVAVDLASKTAKIVGRIDPEEARHAVRKAGYGLRNA